MILRVIRRGQWSLFAVCNERGDCPLLDFLYEGSTPTPFGFRPRGPLAKQKIRLLARLADVAETGPPRNVKICHQIDDDIWQIEHGRVRALWFYDEGRVVILSQGFIKSTQKTPEGEKRLARSALKEYREAKARRRLKILED